MLLIGVLWTTSMAGRGETNLPVILVEGSGTEFSFGGPLLPQFGRRPVNFIILAPSHCLIQWPPLLICWWRPKLISSRSNQIFLVLSFFSYSVFFFFSVGNSLIHQLPTSVQTAIKRLLHARLISRRANSISVSVSTRFPSDSIKTIRLVVGAPGAFLLFLPPHFFVFHVESSLISLQLSTISPSRLRHE